MSHDVQGVGELAAQALLDALAGAPSRVVVAAHAELVVRGSTAPPPLP